MSIQDKFTFVFDVIKKAVCDFIRWLIVTELIPISLLFMVFFIPNIPGYIRSGSGDVSFGEIVYEMTCQGEALLMCIPLIASLILELYEIKKQKGFFLFVLIMLIIFLIFDSFTYWTILKEKKQFELILITAIIPLISLNFWAIAVKVVKAIPDLVEQN
jgi:hypothetical protein